MIETPLSLSVVFHLGPVPITRPIVTSWGIMFVLAVAAKLLTRRLSVRPDRRQAAIEIVVVAITTQISDTMRGDPKPFLPLLGTFFIFLAVANLSGMFPGVEPPTAHIEVAGALALVVFLSTQYYGIRGRGLFGYLKSFARPSVIMLPLNVFGEITRTFSLMVRLFGNIMSGELIIGVAVALAGLLLPVPLMLLEILTGLVQAYIFTILAAVFIGGATGSTE